MGKKLWLGLFVAVTALPLSAGIYIGTDATPPATYQSNANYPANTVPSSNTAGQRNCRLYYDGKGPIPPLTCSGTQANTAVPRAPIPAAVTPPPPPTPVLPVKNDYAAQQQPLARVDTTSNADKPPLTRPTSTATAPESSTSNAAIKPTPRVKPIPMPPVVNTPAPKPVALPVVNTPAPKSVALPVAPKPSFTTTAMPGSLKDNVERIVAQSHWGTVVWNLPIDYNWNGTMTISAPDVQGALSQLLAQYPVQATFYDKNHIVSIEARRVI